MPKVSHWTMTMGLIEDQRRRCGAGPLHGSFHTPRRASPRESRLVLREGSGRPLSLAPERSCVLRELWRSVSRCHPRDPAPHSRPVYRRTHGHLTRGTRVRRADPDRTCGDRRRPGIRCRSGLGVPRPARPRVAPRGPPRPGRDRRTALRRGGGRHGDPLAPAPLPAHRGHPPAARRAVRSLHGEPDAVVAARRAPRGVEPGAGLRGGLPPRGEHPCREWEPSSRGARAHRRRARRRGDRHPLRGGRTPRRAGAVRG